MFGLVTLDNQNRSDAEQQAQRNATVQVERAAQLVAQSDEEQNRASALSTQEQHLNSEASTARTNYEKEVNGTGGSGKLGFGPAAAALRQQTDFLTKQSVAARVQAQSLYHQALSLRSQADQLLEKSVTSLAIGRQQAAIMSVVMFLLSVLTGVVALGFSTNQSSCDPATAPRRRCPYMAYGLVSAVLVAVVQDHETR